MALSDAQVFIGDGSVKDYTILGEIPSESHLRVWLDENIVSSDSWDLLGNTILFDTAPEYGVIISFLVSTTGTDFPVSPSDLSSVAANLSMIKSVSDRLGDYTNTEFIVNGLPASATNGDIALNVEDGGIYQYQSNRWVLIGEGGETSTYPKAVDVYVDTFPTDGLFDGKTVYLSGTNKLYVYTNGSWNLLNSNGVNGTSIQWQGSYPSSAYILNPKEGYSYRNTSEGVTYIYSGGVWQVMSVDGEAGDDGIDGTNGKDGATPVKGVDYIDGTNGTDGSARFVCFIYKEVDLGTIPSSVAVPTAQSFNGFSATLNNGWTDDPIVTSLTDKFLIMSKGTFYQEIVDGNATGAWLFTSWSTPQKYTLEYGVDWINGANGSYTSFIYANNSTRPSTPSGGSFTGDTSTEVIPIGWSDNPNSNIDETRWVSKGVYNYNGTEWATPTWGTPTVDYVKGSDGDTGLDGNRGSSIITFDGGASPFSSSTATQLFMTKFGNVMADDQIVWSTTLSTGTAIWTYNGSSWANNTRWYINGDAVIDGTLYANKLATTALIGKRIEMNSSDAASTYYVTDSVFGTQSTAFSFENTNRTYGVCSVKSNSGNGSAIYGLCSNSSQTGAGVVGINQSSSSGSWGGYFAHQNYIACAATTGNGAGEWGFYTNEKTYSGGGVAPFTGSHLTYSKDKMKQGELVYSTDAWVANIDNALIHVSKVTEANDKRVIGVVSYARDTLLDNLEHNVIVADKLEDGTWKYKDEYKDYIDYMIANDYVQVETNSVGEGGILVCEANGVIENGDYITSSNVSGYGMKQNDDILHSYTVAKALEDVIWDNEVIGEAGCFEQDGVKCKMIACTYHCG